MSRLVSEMTMDDWEDLTQLWGLETLLTKDVRVLRLNLPSREIWVKEVGMRSKG